MDEEIFSGFEKFKEIFSKPSDKDTISPISLLFRSGDLIDSLNTKSVVNSIHRLTGKWPHNKNVELMKKYLKRYIQLLYYKDFYGEETPQRVIKDTDKFYEALKLSDEKPTIKKKPEVEKPKKEPKKEPNKKPTMKLFSKIRTMELDEIEQWARELGVSDESIEKNISKPGNYAKSYMANAIKYKLPENDPLLELA